ncbi:MAG: acetyl-CoA carboxylase carboxyltransferase subunit alpha [Candidatus Omnitrophota bacterium]|nr:acetyl-CoA carboxylase carboxyltransferase subunit alpha [Candidatus Omnitrophota bacterium]
MTIEKNGLDFEKPILELEKKIAELKSLASEESIDFSSEIDKLEKKLKKVKKEIFNNLTPWQRVQVARHPQRPYALNYINLIMNDFVELHGDRTFGDDPAVISGPARLDNQKLMVIGHQKGRGTKERLRRNFGCTHPEGYRKAIRLMKLAEKFNLPIISFIDTPGAYPGIGAEERGQAGAIAYNLKEMAGLAVPVIVVVIGEGGSGGALGIGIGNKVCILENAYYSVISPEGCAAILWKDRTRALEAAEALKLTAQDLLRLGIVDEVIPEPLGGAHRDHEQMARSLKTVIVKQLKELSRFSKKELIHQRYEKFRKMGIFESE